MATDVQQDCYKYFRCLLESLHKHLDHRPSRSTEDCSCIAHHSFSGRFYDAKKCVMCGIQDDSVEPFDSLSFNIARKATLGARPSKYLNDPRSLVVNLLSCLEKLTDIELIRADPENSNDGYSCISDFCQGMHSPVEKRLQIQKLPPTLCIHIERDAFENWLPVKFEGTFRFPLELDMSPYMVPPSKLAPPPSTQRPLFVPTLPFFNPIPTKPPQPAPSSSAASFLPAGRWYDLVSVVAHMNKSEGVHCTAYCKRDGVWLLFNDDHVTRAGEAEVMNANAYLLVYQRRGLMEGCRGKGKSGL